MREIRLKIALLFGALFVTSFGQAQIIISKPVRTLTATEAVFSMAFSPNGQILASGNYDKSIQLWHVDGTLLRSLSGHSREILSLAFSPDGLLLASGSADKTIRLWRVIDGSLLSTIVTSNNQSGVRGLAFSPDSNLLAAITDADTGLFNPVDGTLVRSLTLERQTKYVDLGGEGVCFSPDGRTLAATGGGAVKMWDVKQGNLLRLLEGPPNAMTAEHVAFSPDGRVLAVGGNVEVLLWQAVDGRLLLKLEARIKNIYHSVSPVEVVFLPDGKTLISASSGVLEPSREPLTTIRVWRVSDGLLLQTVTTHDSSYEISLSPDGHTLATAGPSSQLITLYHLR
jgi:WD40 repeat protein